MTESATPTYDALSNKHRAFVDAYTGRTFDGKSFLNAPYAYELVGYKPNRFNASRLKTKENVSQAISEVLTLEAMSDAEAGAIIARQARGTMRPFLRDGLDGQKEIDLSTEEADANLHLIKKLKQKRRVLIDEQEGEEIRVLSVETEIELHDAKDAAHKIRQAHGAYGAKGTKEDPQHVVTSIVYQTGDVEST